jgi:outer membrane protein assembly factor BamE (lipoprotein component of BamABCDE complex)
MSVSVRLLATCLATSLLFGCVLPMPTTLRSIQDREFNRAIDEQSMSPMKVGSTTRKDVLLMLGRPDVYWDNEQVFSYIADATKGGRDWHWLFILPNYYGIPGAHFSTGGNAWDLGPISHAQTKYGERYRLTIWFDDKGIVKDYKFERPGRQ